MPPFIPYARQSINDDDIAAVVAALRSDSLTCGPKLEEFEQTLAAYVGAKYGVAASSGTAALHLALHAAGVGAGDRVVTSPNTFLASANAAAFLGATPDFADIEPVSHNLDPAALEQAWRPDTKAVVAVDYAGQSCDLPAIARVARAHGAVVVEDACHGIGGGFTHKGKVWKLGGHPWADVTAFSFHPAKSITTGEGGMLVTDDARLAETCRRLRAHGVVRSPQEFSSDGGPPTAEKGPWYYEMQDLGYNYRIADILCALGLSQLRRLDAFVARRREIVAHYQAAFAEIPWLKLPGLRNPADCELIAWHLYTVQIDFAAIRKNRTQVMHELRERGVGTQVLYIPVYLQPWYRKQYGYAPGKCPVAESFYQGALSLPLFPAMSAADVRQVVDAVRTLA